MANPLPIDHGTISRISIIPHMLHETYQVENMIYVKNTGSFLITLWVLVLFVYVSSNVFLVMKFRKV